MWESKRDTDVKNSLLDSEGEGKGGMICDGRGVQDGGHMHIHGWFMWMYGKNHYNTGK